MLPVVTKDMCFEVCMKRVSMERALGVKGIDLEKCLRLCKAFAR
jgi:hypothetical protein